MLRIRDTEMGVMRVQHMVLAHKEDEEKGTLPRCPFYSMLVATMLYTHGC